MPVFGQPVFGPNAEAISTLAAAQVADEHHENGAVCCTCSEQLLSSCECERSHGNTEDDVENHHYQQSAHRGRSRIR